MPWKRSPHNCPYVREIRRLPVAGGFPDKGSVMQRFGVISILNMKTSCWIKSRVVMWRPCDLTVMVAELTQYRLQSLSFGFPTLQFPVMWSLQGNASPAPRPELLGPQLGYRMWYSGSLSIFGMSYTWVEHQPHPKGFRSPILPVMW